MSNRVRVLIALTVVLVPVLHVAIEASRTAANVRLLPVLLWPEPYFAALFVAISAGLLDLAHRPRTCAASGTPCCCP